MGDEGEGIGEVEVFAWRGSWVVGHGGIEWGLRGLKRMVELCSV